MFGFMFSVQVILDLYLLVISAKIRLSTDRKYFQIVSIKMKERVPYLCRYDHNLS